MENKLVLKKNELSFLLSLIRLMEKGVRTLTDVGSKSKISDGSKPRPIHFFRPRAQNFEKGPCHARPKIQLNFLRRQRLFKAQVQLELNFQGSGLAEA